MLLPSLRRITGLVNGIGLTQTHPRVGCGFHRTSGVEAMLACSSSSSIDEFLRDFHIYCAVYCRLETVDENTDSDDTSILARKPDLETPSWAKVDLENLLQKKRLHHFFPKIDASPELQKHLLSAFGIQEEKAKIEALCEIRGIGPALASVVLESVSPEVYGALNSHAWNALRLLSFDLPGKRASQDSFTIRELLRYLEIVRRLAREMDTTPAQMARALYAYDKALTDNRWKRQFTLAFKHSATPMFSPRTKDKLTDIASAPDLRILSSPV